MAPVTKKSSGAAAAKAKKPLKFTIEMGVTAKDQVIDPAALEKYLAEHIKCGEKLNNLKDAVKIEHDDSKVVVTSTRTPVLSKRYIKYLTKKYLKKNEIKEYVKIVSSSKGAYELKYFKTAAPADDADE